MKDTQDKDIKKLLVKLDRLAKGEQVRLTPGEARIFQPESLDELPKEDDWEPINNSNHGH